MRLLKSQGLIFVSKPRCGSTSIRKALDAFVDNSQGDLVVDVAGQSNLHPHMNVGAICEFIQNQGESIDNYKIFVTVRHPLDMLWSYFKFFKPDVGGQYNYNAGWDPKKRIDFESWILTGSVGASDQWKKHWPAFVSIDDLSPLSLEAHAFSKGQCAVDAIFKMEDQPAIERWLSTILGTTVTLPHTNQSEPLDFREISPTIRNKIKRMFPLEAALYSI